MGKDFGLLSDVRILRFEWDCNNNCRVCTGRSGPGVPFSDPEESGFSLSPGRGPVIFRGREPTLASGFFELLRGYSEAGVDLHTNARFFSYKNAARDAFDAGLKTARVSIHHLEPEVHDWFTRTEGSHAQTVSGIQNLVHAGVSVWLRVLVTERNICILPGFVELAQQCGAAGIRFVCYSGERVSHIQGPAGKLLGPYLGIALRCALDGNMDVEIHGVETDGFFGLSGRLLNMCRREALVEPKNPVVKDVADGSTPVLEEELSEKRSAPICDFGGESYLPFVIKTTCRNKCNFCTTRIIHEERGNPWVVDRGEDVIRELEQKTAGFKKDHKSGVVKFVAMEPLEHPDIAAITAAARLLSGKKVWIGSSGRILADREFAKEILRFGMGRLEVPLFGPDSKGHDLVAGSDGAFEEIMTGVENLKSLGFRNIVFHMVMVKQNCDLLFGTAREAERLSGRALESITLAAPASWNLDVYREIAFDFDVAIRKLADSAADFNRDLVKHCLKLLPVKIPFCVLQRHFPESFSIDSLTRGAASAKRSGGVSEPFKPGEAPEIGTFLKARRLCPFSEECKLKWICSGVYPEYVCIFGAESLVPVR